MKQRLRGCYRLVLCALALLASGCGAGAKPSRAPIAREVRLLPGDLSGSRAAESPPPAPLGGKEETALTRCAGLPGPLGGERRVTATIESDQWQARSVVLTPPSGVTATRFAAAQRAQDVGLSARRSLACWSRLLGQKLRSAGLAGVEDSIRPLARFPDALLAVRFRTSNVIPDGSSHVRASNIGDLIEGVRGGTAFELTVSDSFVPLRLGGAPSPPPHALELRLYDTLARRLASAEGLAR